MQVSYTYTYLKTKAKWFVCFPSRKLFLKSILYLIHETNFCKISEVKPTSRQIKFLSGTNLRLNKKKKKKKTFRLSTENNVFC